jgi:DNA invertase Pin-like site-specific DNA recombinase
MNRPAAIYARVSSDRQKEKHTIASQTAALIELRTDTRVYRAGGMGIPGRRL